MSDFNAMTPFQHLNSRANEDVTGLGVKHAAEFNANVDSSIKAYADANQTLEPQLLADNYDNTKQAYAQWLINQGYTKSQREQMMSEWVNTAYNPYERSWGEAFTDTFKQVGSGATNLFGSAASGLGFDGVADSLWQTADELNQDQSTSIQLQSAAAEQQYQNDVASGMNSAMAAAKMYADNPRLIGKLAAEQLPQLGLAAIPMVGGAALVGTNVLTGGGNVRKAVREAWENMPYEDALNHPLMQERLKQGMSFPQALEDVKNDYSDNALNIFLGYAIGGAEAATPLAKLGKGINKSVTGTIAKEIGVNALQGGAEQVNQNLAVRSVDGKTNWNDDLGRSMVEEGIGGAAFSPIAGYDAYRNGKAEQNNGTQSEQSLNTDEQEIQQAGGGDGDQVSEVMSPMAESPFVQIKQKIVDFVGRVRENKSQQAQIDLMPVSDIAVAEAQEYGLNVAGFSHLIDNSAINHILNRHGDQNVENSRGQIAVTESDFENIPEVYSSPDKVIYGKKTNRGNDAITYIKKIADGSTLVVEEVRKGKKVLALTTMWKFPSGVRAETIMDSLDLYVRNGADENGASIVQNPLNRNANIQPQPQQAVEIPQNDANAELDQDALEYALANINDDDRELFQQRLARDIAIGKAESRNGKGKYDKFVQAYLKETNTPVVAKSQSLFGENNTQGEVTPEIRQPNTVIQGGQAQIQLGSQGSQTAQYELVEADELLVNLKPNTYQNRDRTSADSQAQIMEYAANLNPNYLGASVDVTQGAPTVDGNYGVFAGNGRLAAIKQAYAKNPQNATAYRDYLAQNAPQFGFTAEQVQGMKQPVLVRKVAGNIDLKKAVEEGNFNTGLDKGVIGNAKANADYISDELLDLVEINDDGSLNLSESNTPFISSLVSRIPVEQRPQFFAEKKQGNQTAYTLTAQGRELVENALLVKAYSDGSSYAENLLTDLITGTEDGNKRVKAALTAIAGKVIQTKGTEYDISADLVQAYDLMSKGKKAGLNAVEAANQGDLLNPPNETVQGLVGLFYSPKSISEVQQPLNAYLDKVIGSKLHQTEQSGMFENENPSRKELLNQAGMKASRSAMKSVEANIKRGKQAMNTAITERRTVHRAMFNHELGGWVDFEWGDDGLTKPFNKKGEPVGKGIAHIIEARQRKDGMSYQDVVRMLTDNVVETIAKGEIVHQKRNDKFKEDRITIDFDKYRVALLKRDGGNAWIITGFEKFTDGERSVGNDTTTPTHPETTLTRQGVGASENPTDEQVGSNDPSLPTHSLPTRQRQGVGAVGSETVRPTVQDVNSSPEIQQAKAIIEKALGKAYADQVNFVRSSDFNDDRATAEGFFQNGKVHIVLDNIYSNDTMNRAERMAWVAWHEFAHNGIDVKYGEQYEQVMAHARSNAFIRRLTKIKQVEYRNEGVILTENLATEESLVELYAAIKTGNWDEISDRYGVHVSQEWKTGEKKTGLEKIIDVVARSLRLIASRITGKDLRKASIDDVLGMLKQIDNAVNSLAENSENQTASSDARYSLNERSDSAFASAVDEVVNGNVSRGYIAMGTTPDVLKMLGLPDTKIRIQGKTIEKVMGEYLGIDQGKHSHLHNLTPETLKRLPQNINNPVAVFNSSTRKNGYVVLTELTETDNRTGKAKPVIAALHLKPAKGGVEIIDIASVYGRSQGQLKTAFNEELLYLNKEKAQRLNTERLQLSWDFTSDVELSARNVKTEADLSQYQAENSSAKYSLKRQNLTKSEYEKAKADGKTELTFQQWKQVRSPEFKRWFGDWENDPENASKVINPRTGEPLVVYHGTNAEFSIFKTEGNKTSTNDVLDAAFFTSDVEYAQDYLFEKGDGKIISSYIVLRNPLENTPTSSQFSDPTYESKIIRQAREKGNDGILFMDKDLGLKFYAVFKPNQIKSATDNNGEFSAENEDIRYSRRAKKTDEPYQRDLIVTHNISADGIMHAHKMGGLPFASVAVAKQDNPLTGFGEVTLIGDRDYIDPKGANKAKVFGSDIYSPRYPSVYYEYHNNDLTKLFEQFEQEANFLGDNTFSYNVRENSKHEGLSKILRDATPVQYRFLKDNDIEIELVYEKKNSRYSTYKSVQAALEKHRDDLEELRYDRDFAKSFLQEEVQKIDRAIKLRKARGLEVDGILSGALSDLQQELNEEPLHSYTFRNAVQEIIEVQNPTDKVDFYRTRSAIHDAIEPVKQDFDNYIQEIVEPIAVKEKLDNGETPSGTRKYIPHTLENVVKKLKKDLRGGESLNYGLPSIRAKVTPQFKTISDIQKNKNKLVTKSEFDQIKKDIEAEQNRLAGKLGINSWDIDNFLWNTVDENVIAAFHYADVENTAENRQAVAEFLKKLKAMPTEYFEAKAKDVTQFSDFVGAVVPENLPNNAYKVLENAGLKLYEYDSSNEKSRADVIKQATNELDEKHNGGVLFSLARNRSKSESLEKLRKAETIRITGKEIEPSEDLRQYKRNALEHGKSLRGTYVNKDTGRKIELGAGGVKEVLQHDYKNPDHLQSIAAIPQIIEQATYIDTLPNEETDKNFAIDEYEYYVAGLNIGGTDYTVKAVVGVSKDGDRYYDHKLSEIEKGDLLSLPSRITNPVGENNSPLSEIDDKRLLQILQEENVENTPRYSRKRSALDIANAKKVRNHDDTFWQHLRKGDWAALKKDVGGFSAKLDEWITDSNRPVIDWVMAMKKVSPKVKATIIGRMQRATGLRDAVVSDLESRYLKPIQQDLAKLAKAYFDGDVETTMNKVGFWISARWAVEKNAQLLAREAQAMNEAEQAYNDAIANKEPSNVLDRLERAFIKAENQYYNRKADVESRDFSNDRKYKVGVAGGWSSPLAQEIMRVMEKQIPRSALEAVAEKVYDLNQAQLKYNLESGRYTQAEYDFYIQDRHYVPLTGPAHTPDGMESDTDVDFFSMPSGKSVNTAKDKTLKGRVLSEADNAITAVWESVAKTATYSGWADFKHALNDVYEEQVQAALASGMTPQEAHAEATRLTGISKQKMQGTTRTNDNVLVRKENGQYYEYRIPDEAINALKSSNQEYSNWLNDLIAKPTRWYARGVTQFTATFAFTNMVRDTWEKSEFIRVQEMFDKNGNPLSDKQKDAIGRALIANAVQFGSTWRATKRYAFGQELQNSDVSQRYLKELIAQGGISTHSTFLAKKETDLIKQIERNNRPLAKRLQQALEAVKGWNAMFDTVSSLSAYQALREAGLDKEQAASITLELTNFRKTGSALKAIKGLYMFAQPTAMGGRNLAKYLSTKHGQKRFVAYLSVAMVLYSALRALSDEDEGGNELDKQGDIDRYIPIPSPFEKGKYIKIPVGFGMPQMAWSFATNLVKAGHSHISVAEALTNMFMHTVKATVPVSPSEISAGKYPIEKAALTATPSIFQPIMQIALNRNAFGSPITTGFVSDKKLKADQAKANTAPFWKETALWLSDAGIADMHPEQLKALWDGYSGMLGSLREVATIMVENTNRERLGKVKRIPFLNTFYGSGNEYAIQSLFYQATEEARAVHNSYTSRKERGTLPADWLTPERKAIVQWIERVDKETQEIRKAKAKVTKAYNDKKISEARYQLDVNKYDRIMETVQRRNLYKWRKMQGLNTSKPQN